MYFDYFSLVIDSFVAIIFINVELNNMHFELS